MRLLYLFFLVFSASFLGICSKAIAQIDPIRNSRKDDKNPMGKMINLPNYDAKLLHFGFFLAINYTKFVVRPSAGFGAQLGDTTIKGEYPFRAVNPKGAAGFTTGFILNVRLSETFDLRVHPTVSFYQRSVEYEYWKDSLPKSLQLSQSTFSFLEMPILIKYKSQRRENMRMFLTAGIKPSLEIGAKKKEIEPINLRSNNIDFSIDYGFGFDFYYPLFKFSPEVRFSHGIVNMKVKDDNPFSNVIGRMTSHTVTFFFNFN